MPRIRTVALTPRQAAVQRHNMKGLGCPCPMSGIRPRPLGGIRPRPLGALFSGPGYINNYWQGAINAPAPYVLSFGPLGARIGPRGMGDATSSPDTYVGADGCVYDTDGIRLTCPNGKTPSFPGDVVAPGPQMPTIAAPALPGDNNNIVIGTQPAPQQPASSSGFMDQIRSWLSKPLTANSSIKNGHLVALAGGLALIGAKKGRRR